MQRTCTMLGALAAVVFAPVARAQPVRPELGPTTLTSDAGSMRSKAHDWMIMPSGMTTLSGSMQFVTARAEGSNRALHFTDIVLLNIEARQAFKRRYELYIGASALPKQPTTSDELAWQGATAGLRVGLGNRYASYLSVATGPLLDDAGTWVAGGVGAQVRKSLDRTLVLEGLAGLAYTSLLEHERRDPSRLMEAVISGEMVFRVPNGVFAGWLGSEFRFPVHNSSVMSDIGAMPYRPQPRVNVHLGIVLSYIDDWDIFAKLAFVDRGDRIDPATTLPLLVGGFDQQHIVVGLTRRFSPETPGR